MIQIIKYKCCGKIFAASREPECYTEKEWLKDLKKYVERGDKVEMIHSGQGLQFNRCQCQKDNKNNEPKKVIQSLFDDEVLMLGDL